MKFEYLENEKSFLDEIKKIFHSFWRPIIWWKNKKLIKIADTNLNIWSVNPTNWSNTLKLLLSVFDHLWGWHLKG